MVHFCSDAVLFECNTLQASDLHSSDDEHEKESYAVLNGRVFDRFNEQIWSSLRVLLGANGDDIAKHSASRGIRGALSVLQELGSAEGFRLREQIEFNRRWYELITAYSEGALTNFTDKLVAIAGVAELVQSNALSPYAAGIWTTVAPEFGLLWRVKGRSGTKRAEYCAPSWSWASVDSTVDLLPRVDVRKPNFEEDHVKIDARVRKILIQHQGGPVVEARSLVDSGMLEITGLMFRVYRRKPGKLRKSHSILAFVKRKYCLLPENTLNFYPDWIGEDKMSLPNTASEAAVKPQSEQLFGLLVMRMQISKLEVAFYGLVLRRKENVEGEQVFERVGVFSISDWTLSNMESISRNWNRATVRVI
jgi:hypothetical protein